VVRRIGAHPCLEGCDTVMVWQENVSA
jgi:hypothetical protein